MFVATATCGVISFIFALLKLPETRNVFFDERHNSINPSVVDHDISYISVWKIACNDKIFLTLSWTLVLIYICMRGWVANACKIFTP